MYDPESATQLIAEETSSLSPEVCRDHYLAFEEAIKEAVTLDKGNEALEWAGRYIQDVALVENSIEDAIELFVELAASGHVKEALGLLVNSPAKKHLEPLEVGLKLFMGEDVKTATEIREVAKDIVKRIEDRLQKR